MYTVQVPSDCIRTEYDSYYLVKYPKDKKHDPAYRLARSLIYKSDGTLVCFSPPKSQLFELFSDFYPIHETVCEEFIDGTMINVFFDEDWKIATKSILGAECTFESKYTFAQLFQSCFSGSISYKDLNPSYTYSFVMQHPENKIVLDVKEPRLYLVGVYEIRGDTVVEHEIPFLAPPRYTFDTYEKASQFVQEVEMKGLMFKCNGVRAKIKNNKYSFLSELKDNSPFVYHYLCIRNTPQKEEYMKHFNRDITKGIEYELKIEDAAGQLLNDYKKCFIYKIQPLKTYMKKNYMYDLHGIFLNELKPKSMNKTRVLEYMNSLPPKRLLTLLQM